MFSFRKLCFNKQKFPKIKSGRQRHALKSGLTEPRLEGQDPQVWPPNASIGGSGPSNLASNVLKGTQRSSKVLKGARPEARHHLLRGDVLRLLVTIEWQKTQNTI